MAEILVYDNEMYILHNLPLQLCTNSHYIFDIHTTKQTVDIAIEPEIHYIINTNYNTLWAPMASGTLCSTLSGAFKKIKNDNIHSSKSMP